MKFLKVLCFMVMGAIFMVACMMWVAQFFRTDGNAIPVIWIDSDDRSEDFGQDNKPTEYPTLPD